MSVSVEYRDGDSADGPFQLASAAGWEAVGAWVHDLPGYETLHELVETGEARNTASLSDDLKSAMYDYPPKALVKKTLDELLETLGVGDESETAVVTV